MRKIKIISKTNGLVLLCTLVFGICHSQQGFAWPPIQPHPLDLPGLNSPTPEVGRFNYGILYDGEIFYSPMGAADGRVGLRAGRHFSLLTAVREMALRQAGFSEEDILEILREMRHAQNKGGNRITHNALGFGFKPIVRGGEIVNVWQGWNSFKSTIHGTTGAIWTPANIEFVIESISRFTGNSNIVEHPLHAKHLVLNPKYLDPGYENCRGPDFMNKKHERLAPIVESVNAGLPEKRQWGLPSVPKPLVKGLTVVKGAGTALELVSAPLVAAQNNPGNYGVIAGETALNAAGVVASLGSLGMMPNPVPDLQESFYNSRAIVNSGGYVYVPRGVLVNFPGETVESTGWRIDASGRVWNIRAEKVHGGFGNWWSGYQLRVSHAEYRRLLGILD